MRWNVVEQSFCAEEHECTTLAKIRLVFTNAKTRAAELIIQNLITRILTSQTSVQLGFHFSILLARKCAD